MARYLNMDGNQISYLKEPDHDHMAATKICRYEIAIFGGSYTGVIGMAGNRIVRLGEPIHQNDAARLSSGNEFYLRRDGSNWMRNDLYLGGFRVGGMANPGTGQDGVNLRTLQASEARLLEQTTDAADTTVSDAVKAMQTF